MEVRRGDRSRNRTAKRTVESGKGGGKESEGVRQCAREKTRRNGEPRERRHPRAHFRFGAVEGDEKGGANSRDINSVLAPGGLQRRKLRAEGEYYPRVPLRPAFIPASFPPPPCSTSSSPPPPGATTLMRGEGGEALQIRD